MLKIIKNGKVYSPDDLGQKDVFIVHDTILAVEEPAASNPHP